MTRLVCEDADNFISSFGDQAYYEARDRAQRDKVTIDGNRPSGHCPRCKRRCGAAGEVTAHEKGALVHPLLDRAEGMFDNLPTTAI